MSNMGRQVVTQMQLIRARYRVWPVLVSLGVVAVLAGAAYIVSPEVVRGSAIGAALPVAVERMWSIVYFAGGVMLLAGVARLDARWEVSGLLLVGGCYLAYAYAVVAERSWSAASIVVPVFVGLGVGCLVRAYLLRFEPGAAPCPRL